MRTATKIIDHGYDGQVYCGCGRASINYLEFKCSDRNHGKHYLEFKAFDLSYALAKLRPKSVFNVLLLGETGTGKSTWINSIAYYLTFSTLEEASKEKKN